jgi:glycosyltransferase involved in cell wall biosynthesis
MARRKVRTILHLPCSYLPWTTGGKEVYTHALARALQAQGWNNHVALHQNAQFGEPLGIHTLDEVTVHVLPPLEGADRAATYDRRPAAVPGFAQLVQEIQPTLVHFQDFSIGANLLHLELARQAGAKTVMTYHTPGQSCLQFELRYAGGKTCDGEIKLDRCTACRLGAQGIPAWIRGPLSKLHFPAKGSSRWQRALSARTMTERFQRAWQQMAEQIDGVHVYAQWAMDLLRRNHVPEEKITFFRTGLPSSRTVLAAKPERERGSTLKIIMAGRCEPVKGQDVLIAAVKRMPPQMRVEISFLGPYWDSTAYGRACLNQIAGDPRFHPPELVPHELMQERLAQADVLAVPSLWLETGPLVVLEGFAAGLPIVGSRLGGIAELVQDGQTGLLFNAGNSAELSQCLGKLWEDRNLLEKLRGNIQPPRTMHHVALDTAQLYEKLLQK